MLNQDTLDIGLFSGVYDESFRTSKWILVKEDSEEDRDAETESQTEPELTSNEESGELDKELESELEESDKTLNSSGTRVITYVLTSRL